jgi:hypothetical protein
MAWRMGGGKINGVKSSGIRPMTDQEKVADLEAEIMTLRAALLPFARKALTREAKHAADDAQVIVLMSDCKAAQKAMAEG